MNTAMQVILEISFEADDSYHQAAAFGYHAAQALQNKHRSQLTGLENIAESTVKIADILDYIKKQTARFPHWRQPLAQGGQGQQGFGERLRIYLEQDLKQRRDAVCGRLKLGDASYSEKQERRRIYLLLIRQFIRSMVAAYEYEVSPAAQRGR
ncbi:MAG TPA: hypothetical protein VGF67_13305 [Ktedonobacteraceae bacterium]|jgi:hypothetical protein